MKRTAIIDVISGGKMVNEIMSMADMRDSYKVFALGNRHVIEFEGDEAKLAYVFSKSYEDIGNIVVFSAVLSVDGVKPENPIYYLKQGVSQISDGKKVGMLRDILQALGYTVEVDERNRVVKLL